MFPGLPVESLEDEMSTDDVEVCDSINVGYPEPPSCALRPRRHLTCTFSETQDDGAIQFNMSSQEMLPIHYNQLVVLQCLATGMVSPLLRIRRVDKTSMVIGGVTKPDTSDEGKMLYFVNV